MIVKMQKVYIAAREADKERLLERLYDLGMVHIVPTDLRRAEVDTLLQEKINKTKQALNILNSVAGRFQSKGGLDSRVSTFGKEELTRQKLDEIVEEVIDINRRSSEYSSRLTTLYHQLQQLAIWGDFRRSDYAILKEKGLDVRFFIISEKAKEKINIEAEVIEPIRKFPRRQLLIAVVGKGAVKIEGKEVRELELPLRDVPEIRAEASMIDRKLKEDQVRLIELSGYRAALNEYLLTLEEEAEFSRVRTGGFGGYRLFAIQGWIPEDYKDEFVDKVRESRIWVAVEFLEPEDDEEPPTLVRYPKWARPIAGLFDILGTVPGYRELDLSGFFMIALPLFAAFLVGDAGYGAIFVLFSALFYRKLTLLAGKEKVDLLLIIGLATLIWGVLSANYFGITPTELAMMGGYYKELPSGAVADIDAMLTSRSFVGNMGRIMVKLAPLWDSDPDKLRNMLIKLSFLIGCVHLSLAKIVSAIGYWPDLRAIAQLGWTIFLWAMLGLIWLLFFGSEELPVSIETITYLLIVGFVLVVLFSSPDKSVFRRIAKGFASCLLPALGTFSDTMSYIRLMAVGLATYYIASAFNNLGMLISDKATILIGAPIILFGHVLNIVLAIIAIFAHGVRLNMLEFSSNAGVQWSGYPFRPFSKASLRSKRGKAA